MRNNFVDDMLWRNIYLTCSSAISILLIHWFCNNAIMCVKNVHTIYKSFGSSNEYIKLVFLFVFFVPSSWIMKYANAWSWDLNFDQNQIFVKCRTLFKTGGFPHNILCDNLTNIDTNSRKNINIFGVGPWPLKLIYFCS